MLRVRAVVMTRDDSSGGWVPMGGGGLSHVTICKVRQPDEGRRHQYLINGERLRDQATILECALKRDLVYNKVNPIFHHWKVGDSKFGLTFQSPADAAAFERGIQTALKEITEGPHSPCSTASSSSPDEAAGQDEALATDSESSSNSQKEMLPKAITIVTSESSTCYVRSPVAEEFPFSRGQGATSAGPAQPLQQLRPPEEEELESIPPCRDLWVTKGYEDYRRAVVQKPPPDPEKIDLCVHFENGGRRRSGKSPWEYSPPPGAEGRLKDPKASPSCRIHSAASPTKHKLLKEPLPSPGAPAAAEDAAPSRCVYCRDVFNHEENGRGQCQDAPDPIGRCVYQFTCMWCAESMLYHCMSDSEGEYSDPCSCDGSHPHFCIRWLALAMLSLVVPCMCCYLPLHACYWCGEHCGCCGGKHKAVR